jgi:hypothetical protein
MFFSLIILIVIITTVYNAFIENSSILKLKVEDCKSRWFTTYNMNLEECVKIWEVCKESSENCK